MSRARQAAQMLQDYIKKKVPNPQGASLFGAKALRPRDPDDASAVNVASLYLAMLQPERPSSLLQQHAMQWAQQQLVSGQLIENLTAELEKLETELGNQFNSDGIAESVQQFVKSSNSYEHERQQGQDLDDGYDADDESENEDESCYLSL